MSFEEPSAIGPAAISPRSNLPPLGASDCIPFLVSRTGSGPMTYAQTRSINLHSPARGVRMSRDAQADLMSRCTAIQLLLPPESAFVGSTAALIHGIPLPAWMTPSNLIDMAVFDDEAGEHPDRELGRELLVEVAYPPPVGRRVIFGVRHRQWKQDPIGVSLVGGVRVLSPARTWLDLAAMIPADYLVAAGDHVLRTGLSDPDELGFILRWAKRRRGVRTARAVVEMLNPQAESPPESRVRYWLAIGGLPAPEVNGEIVIDGEWFARGDLVFRDEKVVVEYEGIVHATPRMHSYDADRRSLLSARGWTVIVLTSKSLRNPHAMVDSVRSHLAQAREKSLR